MLQEGVGLKAASGSNSRSQKRKAAQVSYAEGLSEKIE